MSNQTKKDGGPAFPDVVFRASLRDYFAAAALKGELAAQVPADPQVMPSDEYAKLMAGRAYTFADAMLAARNGGAS